eukprot:TRINITY_DN890_c0_g1_i2.p2 TRINITY_DN890_c0_g1~~TRINITY_DN890_c0_g1_i2.p2  ORF type:complete len:175 (-),score=1.16 TRINITY_DN890_c0_g1_i2:514-1038(-)
MYYITTNNQTQSVIYKKLLQILQRLQKGGLGVEEFLQVESVELSMGRSQYWFLQKVKLMKVFCAFLIFLLVRFVFCARIDIFYFVRLIGFNRQLGLVGIFLLNKEYQHGERFRMLVLCYDSKHNKACFCMGLFFYIWNYDELLCRTGFAKDNEIKNFLIGRVQYRLISNQVIYM